MIFLILGDVMSMMMIINGDDRFDRRAYGRDFIGYLIHILLFIFNHLKLNPDQD